MNAALGIRAGAYAAFMQNGKTQEKQDCSDPPPLFQDPNNTCAESCQILYRRSVNLFIYF